MKNTPKEVYSHIAQVLEKNRYIFAQIAINHLQEIKKDINRLWELHYIDPNIFDRYIKNFRYEAPDDLVNAQSVFIVAGYSPILQISVEYKEKAMRCVVPPTYAEFPHPINPEELIKPILEEAGFHLIKGISQNRLPYKRLAVQGGLAEYGRNNIIYTAKWGSHARLLGYFSDLPVVQDTWIDMGLSKACEKCSACVKICPTQVIPNPGDRFVIHADRCLTNLNENEAPIPDWVQPSWHNSLIGCMKCQEICPLDVKMKNQIVQVGTLTENEVQLFLNGAKKEQHTPNMAKILESIGMQDDLALMGRNLQLLINERLKN
jgi:epoxyqueuosine reductase